MPSPFDVDTAIAHGKGPARQLAALITVSVRDRASRLTMGPDPTPDVVGARVTYTCSGKRHLLVPPPIAVLPVMMQLFRTLAGGDGGECSFRLGGGEFVARLSIEPAHGGERAAFDLPVLPLLSPVAGALLAAHTENGMMYFDDSEFT